MTSVASANFLANVARPRTARTCKNAKKTILRALNDEKVRDEKRACLWNLLSFRSK